MHSKSIKPAPTALTHAHYLSHHKVLILLCVHLLLLLIRSLPQTLIILCYSRVGLGIKLCTLTQLLQSLFKHTCKVRGRLQRQQIWCSFVRANKLYDAILDLVYSDADGCASLSAHLVQCVFILTCLQSRMPRFLLLTRVGDSYL